jgi:predicted nucleic acid-binding protein
VTTARGFVYLDTSAALAHLLSESRTPPEEMWNEALVSSRLLEHELGNRLRALDLEDSHAPLARELLSHVALLEMIEPVIGGLDRELPTGLRTLDALHLASMLFLRRQGAEARLASYDRRLNGAAEAMGFGLYPL